MASSIQHDWIELPKKALRQRQLAQRLGVEEAGFFPQWRGRMCPRGLKPKVEMHEFEKVVGYAWALKRNYEWHPNRECPGMFFFQINILGGGFNDFLCSSLQNGRLEDDPIWTHIFQMG